MAKKLSDIKVECHLTTSEITVQASHIDFIVEVDCQQIFTEPDIIAHCDPALTASLKEYKIGDRVRYIGKDYYCCMDIELVIWKFEQGKIACTFADRGRPSNRELGIPKDTGITTWLLADDLAYSAGSPALYLKDECRDESQVDRGGVADQSRRAGKPSPPKSTHS